MALNITGGKILRPQRVVIYGPEGIGKTTFASQFPGVLFADLEDGSHNLDVMRVSIGENWYELISTVNEIARTEGVCKTLVIDTADKAEIICTDALLIENKQKSIEGFGYGKGYTYLVEKYKELLESLDRCIKAGINVVLIAHARMKKVEQPDQEGAYDHWELKLSKNVAPLVKEWADMLLFCNYKTVVMDGKASGGKRFLYTNHTPWYDAKNRHGLDAKLELDFSSIAHVIPGVDNVPVPVETPAEAPKSGRKSRKEKAQEEAKVEMETSAEKIEEIAGDRDEVPFDEVVEALNEPQPSVYEEDTYVKTADANFVVKHPGDVIAEGDTVITKEEFIQGGSKIAQQTADETPIKRRRRVR